MAQTRLNQLAGQLKLQPGTQDKPAYEILEQPLGTTRYVRIISIGAGASGLNMIRTLRRQLDNFEHVVYEKNNEVGGTWLENRYPGCKCDIPSHNYQFSWRPNPEWTSFFSPAEEIEAYLCRLCKEEKMYEVIRLEHKVTEARWDESQGIWELKVLNMKTHEEFEDYCHFLLDSGGILNNWKWPQIPGLHDFSGELVHSANWLEGFDYSGKNVAVIGNGSSGVQIMPEVQKTAKQVIHFIREPTWIVPPRVQTLAFGKAGSIMNEIEMDENENFTTAQIERFKSDPKFYQKFIKAVEEDINSNFPLMLKDSDYAHSITERVREYMMDALDNDRALCSAIIPEFEIGCRRLTPGVGYLESLKAANVRVVTDSITNVVAQGIETLNGEKIDLDAIICATGFDVSFCPRFPVLGREGNLQDKWTTNLPKAYMSCAVPGVPNYFTFLGPNAPIGHGSVFTITEHIAKYVARIIKKCQIEGIKAIAPSQTAVDQLYEHTQKFMPRTAWDGGCTSWFKNGKQDGPVTALHPGGRIHFFHMLESFRGEDWEYVYLNGQSNRFQYLGNGFSTKETDGSDPTWYLDDEN